MTLVCECGGVLVCQDGSYVGDEIHETYKCESCGRTGTYRSQEYGGDKTTGCVTITEAV